MALKHRLAALVVGRVHGDGGAREGRAHFERVVQKKEAPEDVPEATLPLAGEPAVSLLDALDRLDLVKSRSEGRRLVDQGAVSIDGDRASDALAPLAAGRYLVRIGKRRYLRLSVEP
jgi:tyrosyl-tRNA synthetase